MNIPKLRFKEFNDEWNSYKFYDLVSITNGQVNPNEDDYCNLPHIGPGNIEKETGRLLEYNLAKDDKLISSKYLFNEKSVIYGKINPHFAKVCYPKFVGLCSADAYPINPNEDKLTSTFLLYLLLNPKFTKFATSVSMRTGMPKINRDELGIYRFTIPSLKEQDKIARTLELLDKKIELQNKKIEDLKLFKKGLLNVISKEITESKTIKEICEYKNGNSYEEYVCDEGKYNLISLNSVDINGNLKNDMKKIKLSNPDTLIKNDIVMVLSDVAHGDFLGVSALIDEDNKYVLNQRMGLLRIMDNSIPQFIVEMINNEQRKFKILGQGSSQLNLSKDDILNQKIKYPCIISQKKYATIFNNINTGLKLNKEKLIKLQELKKGLMQNMFV